MPRFFAHSDISEAAADVDAITNGAVQLSTLPGTGRTVTRLRDYLANQGLFNVKDWGALGDGVQDDTPSIVAAYDAARAYAIATGRGVTVRFPLGTYLVTSTITIDQHRIRFVGDGIWATIIQFEPTAGPAICFFLGLGGTGLVDDGVLYECEVSDMAFRSTNTTIKKTAVETKNASSPKLLNLYIGPVGNWTGAGSIGIRTRGRELAQIYNLISTADLPLVIAGNPMAPTLCTDHFDYDNLYLVAATGNYCITVEDGVVMGNTRFRGRQAWVGGRGGFYWLNTVAPSTSNNLSFESTPRVEQNLADAGLGWMFYISSNAAVVGITIHSAFGGADVNGCFLRGVQKVKLDTFLYVSDALIAIDTDASVGDLEFVNCFWQTGCTSNLNGMRQIVADVPSTNSSVLPSSAKYTSVNNLNRGILQTEPAFTRYFGAVADGATMAIGDVGMQGILTVNDSEGLVGEFVISAFGARVTEVTDVSGVFSAALNTAASTNVYWDGAHYTLQNKRGNVRSYQLTLRGSFVVFA